MKTTNPISNHTADNNENEGSGGVEKKVKGKKMASGGMCDCDCYVIVM